MTNPRDHKSGLPRARHGMTRGSARTRSRATRTVRALTTLGVTSAVVGTGYLTAALVPAAQVAAAPGAAPLPSDAPVGAQPSTAVATSPAPHSLTSTTKHTQTHPGVPATSHKSARLPTLATPSAHAAPPAAATRTTAPHTAAPTTTHAPVTTRPAPPPPRPVVTSGGS